MPPRVSPEKLHAHYRAHAMEKLNAMQYMGTKDKDHYFHHQRISMMRSEYRVLKDELHIEDEFPLTEDKVQWRPYRVVAVDAIGTGILLMPCRFDPMEFQQGPFIEGVIPLQP